MPALWPLPFWKNRQRPNLLVRVIAGLRFSIRFKPLLAFLGVTVSMIGIALYGLASLSEANDRTQTLIDDQKRVAIYTELDTALVNMSMMAFSAIAFDKREAGNLPFHWQQAPTVSLTARVDDLTIHLAHSARRLGGEKTPDGAALNEFRGKISQLAPLVHKMTQYRKSDDYASAKSIVQNEFTPVVLQLQRRAFSLKREIEAQMARRANATSASYEASTQRVFGATLIAIGLAVLLGYAISASITWPVSRISQLVGTVAQGKFGDRAEVPNRDEFGDLASNVNSMSKQLDDLYSKVETQRAELAKWNSELEAKVAAQVDEIQRTNRLRRYLPKQVANLITSSGEDANVLSSRRETVTILFADLRGFTSYSNSVDPEQVIFALNTFHQTVGPLIEARGGTLERFLGDGIVVLFNAPLPCDDPADRALTLAQEMQAAFHPAMDEFQSKTARRGLGVGIATGEATMGQIGFEGRFDYSSIGTTPNLAARLCDQASDGQILLCEATACQLGSPLEDAGLFELKGMPKPVPAFQPA